MHSGALAIGAWERYEPYKHSEPHLPYAHHGPYEPYVHYEPYEPGELSIVRGGLGWSGWPRRLLF